MKTLLALTLTMATSALASDFPSHTPDSSMGGTSMMLSRFKAVSPCDLLPDGQDSITATDGTVVRKGTVKATYENITNLNELFLLPSSQEVSNLVGGNVEMSASFIKPLHEIGMFKFFTPAEWVQDEMNPGRTLIGVLYLSQYKDQLTENLRERLHYLSQHTHPEVAEHIKALLNG